MCCEADQCAFVAQIFIYINSNHATVECAFSDLTYDVRCIEIRVDERG